MLSFTYPVHDVLTDVEILILVPHIMDFAWSSLQLFPHFSIDIKEVFVPLVDKLIIGRVEQILVVLQVAEAVELFDWKMADTFDSVNNVFNSILELCLIFFSRNLHAKQMTLHGTQLEDFCVNEVHWVLFVDCCNTLCLDPLILGR